MIPKLQPGDEIRVIAPASSMGRKSPAHYKRAQTTLEKLGYTVTYGQRISNQDRFGTATVIDRVHDLHDAYKDKNVKAILAAHGGWSVNAILPYVNWDIVKANPKAFIGFSDITVLINAIYAKTGYVGYLGPNFSSFGSTFPSTYSTSSLQAVLSENGPVTLHKSSNWQKGPGSKSVKTAQWKVLQPGAGSGVLIGGNVGSFYLLQGNEFQPKLDVPFVLAVEDDAQDTKFTAREFDRRLESIMQLPGARKNLKALIIGRFEPESGVSKNDVTHIVQRLSLGSVPVVAGLDFGHTWPMLTLPIGGKISVSCVNNKTTINLIEW